MCLLQIEPTHILDNSKSCTQLNIIMDSGIHPSVYSLFHHQKVYAKFDLKILSLLLMKEQCGVSPGQFLIKKKKAINLFDWKSSLNNLDVNEQVSVFNETIMNVISNFVPNKLITCDDWVLPGWIDIQKISLWP